MTFKRRLTPFRLSIFLTLLASLSVVLFASVGSAQQSCQSLYGDMNPRFLSEFEYGSYIEEIKGSRNGLVEQAHEVLEVRGIQSSVTTSLGVFKSLVISTSGNHPLNRIAKRLFEKEGTELIYNPSELKDGELASFDPDKNVIYLSHALAQRGKIDSSFFHELRHWSLTRQSRDGKSPYTNSETTRARFGRNPIDSKSAYNGLFSFEELPVWIYELKLLTKNYLSQYRQNFDMAFFIKDYQYTFHETLNIAADVKSLAEFYLEKISQDEIRFSVAKDGDFTRLTLRHKLNYYEIYLPLNKLEHMKSLEKEQLQKYATAYLEEILKINERYVAVLQPLRNDVARLGLDRTIRENTETLEKISRHLSQLN